MKNSLNNKQLDTTKTPPVLQTGTGFMLSEQTKKIITCCSLFILYFPRAEYRFTWKILNDPHSLPLTIHRVVDKLSQESFRFGRMETNIFRQTGILICIRLLLYSGIAEIRNLFEKSAVVLLKNFHQGHLFHKSSI